MAQIAWSTDWVFKTRTPCFSRVENLTSCPDITFKMTSKVWMRNHLPSQTLSLAHGIFTCRRGIVATFRPHWLGADENERTDQTWLGVRDGYKLEICTMQLDFFTKGDGVAIAGNKGSIGLRRLPPGETYAPLESIRCSW